MAKSALNKFVIPAPLFKVRSCKLGVVIDVNEYTFRNLQLQVALKTIKPFWFLNTVGQWEECRKDGVLRTYPHSDGFTPTQFRESALGIADELALKLFYTFRNKDKENK